MPVLPELLKSSSADSCVFFCIVHFCLLAYQIIAICFQQPLSDHSRAYGTALVKLSGAFGLFCLVNFSDAASGSLVLVYILQRLAGQSPVNVVGTIGRLYTYTETASKPEHADSGSGVIGAAVSATASERTDGVVGRVLDIYVVFS